MAPRPIVKISVPDPEMDRPRFGRLSIIVAVCFAVGLIWPSLAGINYVQRPPGSAPAKGDEGEAPAIDGEPEPGPSPSPKSEPDDAVRAAARVVPALTSLESVSIDESVVVSCQDGAQPPVARCDTPSLVGIIEAPLGKLARCEAAEGASGVLSLGLALDFSRGHVTRVKAGASTTLSKDKSAALVTCAQDLVVGTPLDGVDHKHTSYWVYYLIRFLPPGSPVETASAPSAEEIVSASGQGTIGWKTAVVREAPSREAKIAARLLYGTRVNVTGRMGEWYRINHDGGNIGWVHRKAIGM